jgi:hypothetical protein
VSVDVNGDPDVASSFLPSFCKGLHKALRRWKALPRLGYPSRLEARRLEIGTFAFTLVTRQPSRSEISPQLRVSSPPELREPISPATCGISG